MRRSYYAQIAHKIVFLGYKDESDFRLRLTLRLHFYISKLAGFEKRLDALPQLGPVEAFVRAQGQQTAKPFCVIGLHTTKLNVTHSQPVITTDSSSRHYARHIRGRRLKGGARFCSRSG